MKHIVVTVFSCLVLFFGNSQIGGTTSYPFLDLPFNARNAALSGTYIAVKDADLNIGLLNPSVLNQQMHQAISVSQIIYPGKINYGSFAYGHSLNEKQTFSASMRYLSYGKMNRTDKYGTNLGSFSPLEYILGVGYGYQQNERISVGVNLNLIGSHMEAYNSFGTSLDLAGTYLGKSERFIAVAMFKNVGLQFNAYTDKRANLPTNLMLAISQRLEHAPFRFSILMHHLNKWDITYYDPSLPPTTDMLSGKLIKIEPAAWYEKIAQHLIGQVEIETKRIHLRVGFDYHTRQTLGLKSKLGMSGFSFGTGLHFKRFSIDYGFFSLSKAGTNHVFSISSSIPRMRK